MQRQVACWERLPSPSASASRAWIPLAFEGSPRHALLSGLPDEGNMPQDLSSAAVAWFATRAQSSPKGMRPVVATFGVAVALAACAVDDGKNGSCPGQVTVNEGLLAGGSAGQAIAASSFVSPLGARVLFAGSVAAGCALETSLGEPRGTVKAATMRLMLAPGLGPGTYSLSTDAGAPVAIQYGFTSPYYGGYIEEPQSGTLTLIRVDSVLGVEGSYHVDFGGGGISGGSGSVMGSLGELIEDGNFVAPVCSLCGVEATCGGAVCPSDEVCSRSCGGLAGDCIPAPSCSGAPSCGDCTIPSGVCCDAFDGLSLLCGCFP
jgi:hypothetical protein